MDVFVFQLFITVMDKLRLEIRAMDEVCYFNFKFSYKGFFKNLSVNKTMNIVFKM